MTDWLNLAMTYGGFTSLDKTYLTGLLNQMTEADKGRFLTPPPSVVNAYFAEHYQKTSPEAAMNYYLGLCKAFKLFSDKVSFANEIFPFIRLNLSGQAYGFAYVDASGLARVFGQENYPVTDQTLVFLAQLFPHYQVFCREGDIFMAPLMFDEELLTEQDCPNFPLVNLEHYKGYCQIRGYNVDDVLDVAKTYAGQSYYQFSGREFVVTVEV